MPRTFKLTLAYDGTPFVGWQRQAAGVSIQGLIEEALGRIEGSPVTVIGAGRTDAGVHALGQVASCRLKTSLEPATLARALNATLPSEIRVTAVRDVADSFHARYDARSKTYCYRIVNGTFVMPFDFRYVWHIGEPLDVDAMAAAAGLFEGEHDFAAFRGAGSSVVTSRRFVLASHVDCTVSPTDPDTRHIVYEVRATGFLRHMVRAMVGTLVEIGTGRRDGSSLSHALASGARADAGPTAPAHGLCLMSVDYDV